MCLLSLEEVLELHRLVLAQTGGGAGLRDLGALQSAVAQPQLTGGADLYPTVLEKAAAMCFSIVSNHPFVDGNKRVGHAALETMLVMNGLELDVGVDDSERIMLALAAGELERSELLAGSPSTRSPRRSTALRVVVVGWKAERWSGQRDSNPRPLAPKAPLDVAGARKYLSCLRAACGCVREIDPG